MITRLFRSNSILRVRSLSQAETFAQFRVDFCYLTPTRTILYTKS